MRNYVTTYDPFFDLFFRATERNNHNYIMDTDVLDRKDKYEIRVNVGSANKENIKLSLENGYLTINVSTADDYEDKVDYIFKERNGAEYERSYYVGEYINMKDVSAKLENNTLFIYIKKVNEEEINKAKYIQIQ
ncbi:MAG: Hsp20/alpha crystallin family protein [Bacilli bacterium]|nr:Hsp20/alpha crystallin family protein [Bacilli bacterium]